VEQLRDEIYKMQKLEEELKTQIPDVVTVSVFQVQCKEIKAYLCEKYYMMSKGLIDMIAKKAKLSI
jgi:dynein heavy chain